jgi:hypothetical protein
MRTTVTLEPDVEALVRKAMRERGVTFKQAVNEALRAGLVARRPDRVFETSVRSMGAPQVDLTKALQLAGHLEDEEIVRKLELRK